MFCKWKNNSVVEPVYRGNTYFIAEDGTQHSKAFWGRHTSDDERAAHDIYRYTEIKPPANYNGSNPVYTKDGYMVTKTYTHVLHDVAALKPRKISEVNKKRKQVETGGVYVERGGKVYVLDTAISSQNRVSSAVMHLNEGTATDRKWSFYQETGGPTDPNATWEGKRVSLSKAIFKSIGVEMGDHVDACFDAEDVHIAAITALSTSQEVMDYDVNANWPVNPVHPDNREVL